MDLKLQGKIAIVTGASMGIGRGIAEALAREGAHLVIAARRRGEEHAPEQRISVDEYFAREAQAVPLKRWGTSEEVGDLVTFLASERAGYITGFSITIAGGYVRSAI